ncbi:PHB depolymerase family esterase [Cupriavidus sp. AU9028]|uniref:extracellular catalytic domain type 1 short-chain-length polyhydroxyalkanoate depolymerase n=1 Tax=Cupriavidus sp. AU9028 TaxID=2871157 RepID=UPI001C96E221|nr:PHB depolymerase family esterase [Cupriavidus sp. AU9028]MBY4896976.1 PHB depolymerase family esterase [Cupriavidus sp. AU9028]
MAEEWYTRWTEWDSPLGAGDDGRSARERAATGGALAQAARALGLEAIGLRSRGVPSPEQRVRSPWRPAELPTGPLPGRWQGHRLKLPLAPGELLSQLNYRLYEPSHRTSRASPVVVMLHGCGQNADDFASGTRMNALAEQQGFLVAYPEQTVRRQLQRCWHWFDLAAGEGLREVQAIGALIDTLASRPDVDPSRIYLAGLSAGAAMAAVVALRYPDKVAAVGLHSGVVIGAADSARSGLAVMRNGSPLGWRQPVALLDAAGVQDGGAPMPALILHGLDDDVVNPVNARLLARQFLAYNRMGRLQGDGRHGRSGADQPAEGMPELANGHYLERRYRSPAGELVQLCEIAGLDHAWSGGDPAYRYHSATGPDASALMWDFFRRYRR